MPLRKISRSVPEQAARNKRAVQVKMKRKRIAKDIIFLRGKAWANRLNKLLADARKSGAKNQAFDKWAYSQNEHLARLASQRNLRRENVESYAVTTIRRLEAYQSQINEFIAEFRKFLNRAEILKQSGRRVDGTELYRQMKFLLKEMKRRKKRVAGELSHFYKYLKD